MLSDFQSASSEHNFGLVVFKKTLWAFGSVGFWRMIGKADILHTTGWLPDFLVSLVRPRDSVATVRNIPTHDYPPKFGRWLGALLARTHLVALRRIRSVVACSVSVREAVEIQGVKFCSVVRNGMDFERWTGELKVAGAGEEIQECSVPKGDKVMVIVGSLIPRKNCEPVIRWFVDSGMTSWWLFVVGDGPERGKLEEIAGRSERIRFFGFLDDVSSVLGTADVFVSLSKSEGLPNAVLEALSLGVPCLLSDIPPHREIFEATDSGVSVMRDGDMEKGFSTAVVRAAEKKVHRDVVRRVFDKSVNYKAYLEVYRSMA